MIAYKASYGGKCQSLTYVVGKTYTFKGKLSMCESGFHFCKDFDSLLNYYPMKKDLVIFEIKVLGEVIDCRNKSVTNKLKVIRRISLSEFNKNLKNHKFDKNNNLIHFKDSNGIEEWNKYDKKNNSIYFKDYSGVEEWREFDKNNNLIYHKDSNGIERWREYDKNNNLIHFKDSRGVEWRIEIA